MYYLTEPNLYMHCRINIKITTTVCKAVNLILEVLDYLCIEFYYMRLIDSSYLVTVSNRSCNFFYIYLLDF